MSLLCDGSSGCDSGLLIALEEPFASSWEHVVYTCVCHHRWIIESMLWTNEIDCVITEKLDTTWLLRHWPANTAPIWLCYTFRKLSHSQSYLCLLVNLNWSHACSKETPMKSYTSQDSTKTPLPSEDETSLLARVWPLSGEQLSPAPVSLVTS